MKILLIAYSFPPLQEAQSFRWYYLSNELAKNGVYIDVVTIKYPERPKYHFKIHSNITCKRIFPGFFEYLTFTIRSGLNLDITPDGEIRQTTWFKLLQQSYVLTRKVISYFIPGDVQTEWFPFVISYVRRLVNNSNYDFLITSQEPPVDSFIGLYLKNKFPHIAWIADIADPLTALYYPSWRRAIDELLELKILTKADAVTVTCEGIIDYFSKKYKIDRQKFHLVTQGFRQDNCLKPNNKSKNKVFTLVYSGTFYKHFRDPENLIKALKELPFPYKLIVLGRNEHFLPLMKQLGNNFSFLGFVPHHRVAEYQSKADLLLHIGNRQTEQIPGKFFEYLGAKKPILTIAYNDDESAYLTRKLGVGLVCRNHKNEIKNVLTYIYKLWKEDKISAIFNPNPEEIEKFSWQTQAKKLLNLLNSLKLKKVGRR